MSKKRVLVWKAVCLLIFPVIWFDSNRITTIKFLRWMVYENCKCGSLDDDWEVNPVRPLLEWICHDCINLKERLFELIWIDMFFSERIYPDNICMMYDATNLLKGVDVCSSPLRNGYEIINHEHVEAADVAVGSRSKVLFATWWKSGTKNIPKLRRFMLNFKRSSKYWLKTAFMHHFPVRRPSKVCNWVLIFMKLQLQ